MTEEVQFQQKGAIVRIKLRNFMIYTETEIRPGPNLNMILGPNGTGKSAIVCCIIVGLAGEVSLTGRGSSPADFVKKNTDWGSTQIELYNNRGPNYIVERKISITGRTKFKNDHKSEWRINGQPCLKAEVQALTKKLNIKVDNPCQFLPQDCVTQFVKMNTCELLINTLKAAGDNQLVEDHQKLVTMTKDVEEKRSALKILSKTCQENEVNVRRLESEVHQLRQREELIKEKEICSEKIFFAKYKEAKSRCDEAKVARDNLKATLTAIINQTEPHKLSMESYKSEERKMRQALGSSVEEIKSTIKLTDVIRTKIEELKHECENESSKFKMKQSEEAKRESSVRLKQQELETYECKLHDLRDVDCSRQIAQLEGEMHGITDERKLLQRNKGQLDEKLRSCVTDLNELSREKEQIKGVNEKKLTLLKNRHPDTFKVLEWYSKNTDKFKHKIFQPMMVEINVKDAKYNRVVENAINRQELIAFVCQSTEDLRTFTRSVRDELKISFNVILAPEKTMDQFDREASTLPDLKSCGVKAYLRDLIDAPEPIMRYLCGTFNFHRIPVADGCSEVQLKQLLAKVPKFYVGDKLYTVNRSRYDRELMTVQEPVRGAYLLVFSFDKQRFDQCKEKYNQVLQAQKQAEETRSSSLARDDELKKNWQDLMDKHKALLNKQSERTRLETVMKIVEKSLERLMNEKIDMVGERDKFQKSIEKINLNIVEHLRRYSKVLEKLAKLKQLNMNNVLLVLVAVQNYRLAENKYKGAQKDTTRLERDLRKLQENASTLKSQLNTALAIAVEKVKGFKSDGTLSRSTQTRFSKIDQNTVDDLTYKMEDLVARIQRIYQDSSNTVLNEYNRLNEELKDIRFKIADLQTSITEIDTTLEGIKKDWLPKLNEVIRVINSNYSDFMKKLCYDGEVRLDLDEQQPNNFGAYGILILVKYRDNESLIPLSSTRQSGGERSVATMLYMLALQAKTTVPFRVVDEINQGMDKDNERKVFELLVQIADRSSSQYFLVSPKLLNNLPYSAKMMIHVVFNGKKLGLSWNEI